ncbi:Glycosyltransferase involved in cell wall bisynthesis [Arenibacter nanhaiticus]|uniref:Glycosyltransferase involved in cell wall bisynthesis n=1 Tax=Arenibacter nanhaiticus TaxID=558155 RepID=A0A1M6A3G9_9FLAO|nr:glycosyltransferase [Arenibacter nanhaiticus]SHI30703.1 Glycosyltransferase involved in cell wall bisynthesis [Arenibacter nanhaiticus]
MKNLYFIFPITGPNNGVKVISNHIKRSIFNNNPISVRTINTAQAEDFSNFGKFSTKKVFHFFKLFKSLFIIEREDMVYVNVTPSGFAFYRDLIILFLCSFRTTNITAHIHANGLEKKVKIYNKFLFAKLKIIVINVDQKGKLDSLKLNTFLVPNSLPDYFENTPIRPLQEAGIKLIYLSNISKPKGIERLIKIAEVISSKKLDCILNVFGGALSETEKCTIKDLDLKYDFLNYHGPILDEREKYDNLLKNDALLFLSDENYEVYPLVYIESLMSGLPILTTKQIVSDNFSKIGVADILNENTDNFEAIITNYLEDPQQFHNRKIKSRDAYKQNYSYNNFIQQIEKIILHDKN